MKKRILLFTISLLSACNNQQQQPVEQLQETIRVHNIPINVITPQNGVPIDFEKKRISRSKNIFRQDSASSEGYEGILYLSRTIMLYKGKRTLLYKRMSPGLG